MRLSRTAGGDHLVIADDGRGGAAEFGNGLSGMRERVMALGGTLTREGGTGTQLTIVLPRGDTARIAESA
jgi:two-component system sensor histidine kinase DesK